MNSLIIKTREYGFCSSMFQILDNLKYCELHNMKPILSIGQKFLYQDVQSDNIWNEFFIPINNNQCVGNSVDITELTSNANFLMEDFLMVSPKNNNYRLKLWELHCNGVDTTPHRNEINALINTYLNPIPEIRALIDDFKTEHLNKNILGVHIRGTDYGYHNLDSYINRIKDICDQYDGIYVASDNIESINRIKNEFKNVVWFDTNLRAEHLTSHEPVCHIVSGADKIKHGKDVWVEVSLLSACSRLICINSNVAAMGAYMNPDIKIDLLIRQHGGG
jgi:hypothetical protein